MFTLFQKKANVSQNLVHANTVYRNKEYGYGVFVCGVSRPKSKSFIDSSLLGSPLKTHCTLDDGSNKTIESYMCGLDPNKYCHIKKDCANVIIMYKSTNVQILGVSYTTLANFLDKFELVIGYTENGSMITDAMIDGANTE